MNFAKPNIRISLSLSLGEPLITDDRRLHQKTLKILSDVNSRTCVHRDCNSPSTVNPYGQLLAIVILTLIPSWSCYYKIPWKTRRCFDNPLSLLPCCSLSPEYPYGWFSHLSSIRSSPSCSCVTQKSSKYHLIFRKSSATYCSGISCLLSLWLIP